MTDQSKLRHDIRGRFNGLKLCAAALEITDSKEELLEFLGHIEDAAEGVIQLIGDLEFSDESQP